MGGRIVERQQERPPAQLGCGGGNMLLNEIQGMVLRAQFRLRSPCGIVVKLAPRRIRGLPIVTPDKASAAELATAICPSTRTKNAGCPPETRIKILPGGQRLVGPQRMVPTAAQEPLSGQCG